MAVELEVISELSRHRVAAVNPIVAVCIAKCVHGASEKDALVDMVIALSEQNEELKKAVADLYARIPGPSSFLTETNSGH
jgi:hypothetical protein